MLLIDNDINLGCTFMNANLLLVKGNSKYESTCTNFAFLGLTSLGNAAVVSAPTTRQRGISTAKSWFFFCYKRGFPVSLCGVHKSHHYICPWAAQSVQNVISCIKRTHYSQGDASRSLQSLDY